jgi:hypothetical protein
VHSVDEQHREQRQIRCRRDYVAARSDVDPPEETVTDQGTADEEQQRGGENRSGCQAREEHRDKQRRAEDHYEHHGSPPISRELSLDRRPGFPALQIGTLHSLQRPTTGHGRSFPSYGDGSRKSSQGRRGEGPRVRCEATETKQVPPAT